MKKFLMICAMSLSLAACSDTTLNKITAWTTNYNHMVDNFNAAAAAIDTSIATTSASLAKYCGAAVTAGNNLVPLVRNSTSARTGLATVTSGLTTWCDAPPTDVATAISSMSAVVASAVEAYQKAKAGS